MWVRYLNDGSYKPSVNRTVDYKKGDTQNIPTTIADKLIADGKAEAATDIVSKSDAEGMPKRPGTGRVKAKPEGEA